MPTQYLTSTLHAPQVFPPNSPIFSPKGPPQSHSLIQVCLPEPCQVLYTDSAFYSLLCCFCSQISLRPGVRGSYELSLHVSVSLCAQILTPEVSTRHDFDTNKHFEMPCVWAPRSQCDARSKGHAWDIEAEKSLRLGPTPVLRLMLPLERAGQGGRRNLWTHGSQKGGRVDPHMQWGFISCSLTLCDSFGCSLQHYLQ